MATRDQIATAAQIIRQTVSARQYADLIGLPVDKSGFAQCPFHSGDHTASLKVYGGTRGWHCFGCGAGGDVIELAKRMYGLPFPQAVERVAADAGLTLPGLRTTYEEAQALKAAQQAKARADEAAKADEAIDKAYYEALDDWLTIDRAVDALAEAEWEKLKDDPVRFSFTAEEVAQADADRKARLERIRRRAVTHEKVVLPEPRPIIDMTGVYDTKTSTGFSKEFSDAVIARNTVREALQDLDIRRNHYDDSI